MASWFYRAVSSSRLYAKARCFRKSHGRCVRTELVAVCIRIRVYHRKDSSAAGILQGESLPESLEKTGFSEKILFAGFGKIVFCSTLEEVG